MRATVYDMHVKDVGQGVSCKQEPHQMIANCRIFVRIFFARVDDQIIEVAAWTGVWPVFALGDEREIPDEVLVHAAKTQQQFETEDSFVGRILNVVVSNNANRYRVLVVAEKHKRNLRSFLEYAVRPD